MTTTTVPGGTITGLSLSRWKELNLEFRTGRSQENQAVQVGWEDHQGSYQISLPPGYGTGKKSQYDKRRV